MLLRPSRSPRVCHSLQCRHEDRYVLHSCKSWHRSGRCVHLVWSRAEFAVGCKLLDSCFSSPRGPTVCFRLGSSRFPGDEGQTPSRNKADRSWVRASEEAVNRTVAHPPPPPPQAARIAAAFRTRWHVFRSGNSVMPLQNANTLVAAKKLFLTSALAPSCGTGHVLV